MSDVLLGLVPGTVLSCLLIGFGLLLQLVVAVATAVACEALAMRLKGRPLLPALSDYSALVTAWLLVLCLGPEVPWWCAGGGAAFAILLAKHLFGGLGGNPFNPAMCGYVFLLLVFPAELTFRTLPQAADSITTATPLAYLQAGLADMSTTVELYAAPTYAALNPGHYAWLSFAWLLGGCWLLFRRTINWRIPVGVLVGLFLAASVGYLYDDARYPAPWFHVLMGGTMLCAFFVATDPVSSPASPRGRLIYGIAIGVLIFFVRSFGNYADGVAFAVLMMNTATPLLDAYARPRVLGT